MDSLHFATQSSDRLRRLQRLRLALRATPCASLRSLHSPPSAPRWGERVALCRQGIGHGALPLNPTPRLERVGYSVASRSSRFAVASQTLTPLHTLVFANTDLDANKTGVLCAYLGVDLVKGMSGSRSGAQPQRGEHRTGEHMAKRTLDHAPSKYAWWWGA